MNFTLKFVIPVMILVAAVTVALGLTHQTAKIYNPCAGRFDQAVHSVTIQDGRVTPRATTAQLCDSLTITNLDKSPRLIAFGQHDHHEPYNGVAEKLLAQGQSLTVQLDQAGNFRFHDHLDDTVQGTFSVTGN